MRSSFHQRRRAPNFRIFVRGDENPNADGLNDDGTSHEEESDDEQSADENSDAEDEPDTPSPTTTTFPSSSLPPETKATSISNPSTTPTAPATTLSMVPVVTATTLLTKSEPPKESVTVTTSSQSTVSGTPPISLSSPTATLSSPIINLPAVSTSVLPTLTPTGLASTAPALPKDTSSAEHGGSNNASQGETTLSPSIDRAGSIPHSSRKAKAGEISGATIGSIVLVALIAFGIWSWRRRRSRKSAYNPTTMSGTPMSPVDDDMQYQPPQPREPSTQRSPSSIMNQLMTAAYAAEDGMGYRNSEQDFDRYAAAEKQRYTAHRNESTERLTAPAAAQMRHQSVAARTETTSRSESTWKTWGVLAGSSQPPHGPSNWWVDRYFRTLNAK